MSKKKLDKNASKNYEKLAKIAMNAYLAQDQYMKDRDDHANLLKNRNHNVAPVINDANDYLEYLKYQEDTDKINKIIEHYQTVFQELAEKFHKIQPKDMTIVLGDNCDEKEKVYVSLTNHSGFSHLKIWTFKVYSEKMGVWRTLNVYGFNSEDFQPPLGMSLPLELHWINSE